MPEPKPNHELDLLEFFLKAVNVLRANFWLIVIFFFAGSGLGLFYFYSSQKVFESQMIVRSDILTESYSIVAFETLSLHLAQGNTSALAHALNLPGEKISAIHGFSIERVIDTDPKESDRFMIQVVVSDPRVLPFLQAAIVEYLEKNDFVKVRVEQRKNLLKATILETEKELQDLQEFKTRIFKGDFFERMKGNIMFDPTVVNTKILELSEKKFKLENELGLANSVEVILGFTQFVKQTKPKLSVSMVAGSGVGLFFVAVLIAFKSVRKLLAMAEDAK